MAWTGVGILISLSQDDLSGNSGSFTAYSRACLPGMMPFVVEHLSPSRRIYPPACRPYGLEAEPEALRTRFSMLE